MLGPLEVVRDGEPVAAGAPKQQALLVLLLLRMNRFVAADWLVDALWNGRPPVSGQTTLRTYVAGLRRALEPQRAPRGPGGILVGHPKGYELRIAPDAVDAVRFERLVGRAAELLAAGDAAAAERCYRAALALCRGEPLTAAADLDAVRPEAARLAELRLGAEEGRLTAGLAAGRHETLLPELRRFVATQPLREVARARLMLALYRSGRQTDALAVYDEGRRLLAREYGLDPGEQLREAHRLVLDQAVPPATAVAPAPSAPVREAPRAVVGSPVAGGVRPVAAAAGEVPGALAGRDAELARLGEALVAAVHGDGRLVAVVGEAGIGKTSLAAAVSARAATSGTPVVWGRCPNVGQAPPFWLWTQVVRSLRAMPQAGETGKARSLGGFAAEPLTASGADLDPAARFRAYEAVADLIRAVARQRGLLVVLDDLHAADPDSLLLLRFLSPLLAGTRALVLVTSRPYHRSAGLLATVAELARERNFTRLALRGLDASSVAILLTAGTGARPPDEVVARLVNRTGGNPFFITELLRSGADPADVELPATVRDAVRLRLDDLPGAARDCLDLLGVAGHELDLHVLAAALGTPVGEAGERLVPAYASALVAEAEPGKVRFRHQLFAEVAYAELAPPRRAALHARLATAGERAGSGLAPAELAHHYGQAVGLGHGDDHLRWSLVAADDATGRMAYEDALGHLGRAARRLAPNSAVSPETARTELTVQLHRAALLQMTAGIGSDPVDEVCSRARKLLAMVGPEVDLRPALWALGELAANRADFGVCADLARRLRAAEDDGTGLISAAGEYLLGVVGYFAGRLPEAERHLTAAVDRLREVDLRLLGRQVGRRPALAAHNFRALVRSLQGRSAAAREDIRAAEILADQVDDPHGRANAALFDGWRALQERDVPGVRAAAERCRLTGAATGLPHFVTTGEFLAEWASAYGGDPGRLPAMRAAGEAIYRPGLRSTRTITLCAVAEAYLVGGERATAAELAEQALSVAEQLGERVCVARLRRIRGAARHDPVELRAGALLAVEQGAGLLLDSFPETAPPAPSRRPTRYGPDDTDRHRAG
ncbi:BTAD domain-containing putative transcriptional regulator [Micromonospora rubida]|uniref:BTAD domain-containing putative transcriptional regulator n=1 Tax=Micromonospora rubida TaxID=2697657 RepID=UPI002E2815B8|nr:BTAD domain-containing putative transcriptional regulator [Micromonospora rubida]